ncbi:hypothetical protein TrLO_g14236 [Triparma laevis f. longispina]|uniref:Uncharacterized protein n=1 Tax=Triparma laevis f. longispina TaxID=1714387 RepID=A0A9W7FTR3_9STRA|nr:hypothetical protein TrLO_g14236 [Triparma laevis f. longispina]
MPFPRPPLEAQPRRITLNVDSDMLANFSFPYSPKNKGVGGEGFGGDGGAECILFSGSGRTNGREREDGRREKMETKKKKKSDEEEGYSVKVLYSTLVSLLTNKEKLKSIFNSLSYSRKCSLIDLNISVISEYEQQGQTEYGGGSCMEGLMEGFKILGVLAGSLRLGRMKGDEKCLKRVRKGLEALRESSCNSAFRGEIVTLMFKTRLMLGRKGQRDAAGAESNKLFGDRFSSGSLYIGAPELKKEEMGEEKSELRHWLGVDPPSTELVKASTLPSEIESDWRRFPEFREDFYFRR